MFGCSLTSAAGCVCFHKSSLAQLGSAWHNKARFTDRHFESESDHNAFIQESGSSTMGGCGTLFWFYQFSPCFLGKLEDVTHVNTAVRKMPWTTLQSLRRRRDPRWNRKFVEPPVVLAARGVVVFVCCLSYWRHWKIIVLMLQCSSWELAESE